MYWYWDEIVRKMCRFIATLSKMDLYKWILSNLVVLMPIIFTCVKGIYIYTYYHKCSEITVFVIQSIYRFPKKKRSKIRRWYIETLLYKLNNNSKCSMHNKHFIQKGVSQENTLFQRLFFLITVFGTILLLIFFFNIARKGWQFKIKMNMAIRRIYFNIPILLLF